VRIFVLIANFVVDPNFNFREIKSLGHLSFLFEQVSVVGEGTARSWQWVATATMLLLVIFVIDAALQAWRKNVGDSRRKALTVGLALVVPMVGNLTINQMVVFGLVHIPLCATLWFLGTLTVISYELGRELITNVRARLQLAELRSEWAQVERVNALGQLASALAHELVQPLTAAQGNADAARRYLERANPDLDELRVTLEDIHSETRRAADVIDRMRLLIRRGTLQVQPLGMTDVVQDVLALLRYEAASRNVSLKSNLPPGLPLASADRVHISQVLMNLLINGMDAVAGRPADARLVMVEAQADAGDIEITVEDSGPGIPDGRLEEVFTPFYTTKSAGIGMGLTVSRMIVSAHGGRLWAENGRLGGAVFRFTIPREPH
jgi:C4-dicarboxylate-specific signal transduction histidine kinase